MCDPSSFLRLTFEGKSRQQMPKTWKWDIFQTFKYKILRFSNNAVNYYGAAYHPGAVIYKTRNKNFLRSLVHINEFS